MASMPAALAKACAVAMAVLAHATAATVMAYLVAVEVAATSH
jgi:hypothetical protein